VAGADANAVSLTSMPSLLTTGKNHGRTIADISPLILRTHDHTPASATMDQFNHTIKFSPSHFSHLFLRNVTPLTNIQTVQEFSDILVPYSADLLNIGGRLRDVLEGFTTQFELILHTLRWLDRDTWCHLDVSDEFLA